MPKMLLTEGGTAPQGANENGPSFSREMNFFKCSWFQLVLQVILCGEIWYFYALPQLTSSS